MFISLSDADTSSFSARDWRRISPVIRRILSAYEHRKHVFYLSPNQLEGVSRNCDLNDEDRRILEGSFASRILDFAVLYRKSLFRLVIDSRLTTTHIDVGPPYVVTMPVADFLAFDVLGAAGLYAENIANDSEWYLFLTEIFGEEVGLPNISCSLDPSHAGGGGLVGYFPRFLAGRRHGICVLDRDSSGDWEPIGRHARDMRANALRARIIANDAEDYSSIVPFVGIKNTTFRNVASSIPPSVVRMLYRDWDAKPDQLSIFSKCFSGFPALSGSDSWALWLGLNFETPATRAEIQASFEGRIAPRILTRYLDAVDDAGPPRLPKGATGTVIAQARRSPNIRRAIEQGFSDAMLSAEYRNAVMGMVEPITHMGASYGGSVL